MNKILFTGVLMLFFLTTTAQVGINNTDPKASLDITASNVATPTNTDGILIPRIDNFPSVNPGIDQDGMLVYATGNGTPTRGFYYWNNTTTSWLTAIGSGAAKIDDLSDGKSDSDGSDDGSSIFLGIDAGVNDDSSNNANIGLGYQTLTQNTTGSENIAFGYQGLYSNTTGTNNISIGYQSLYNNNANVNIGIGGLALYNNTSGAGNIGLGSSSLYTNVSGNYNIAIGESSQTFGVGDQNTSLGFQSLYSTTGSGNVAIGYEAGYNETGSNKLYIENSNNDSTGALIYGEFDDDLLRVNAEFQIGVPTAGGYTFPTNAGTTNYVLQTDGIGTLSWVDNTTLGTDDQQIDVFNLSGTTLQLSLQDDGVATQTVDLSSLSSGNNTLDDAYDEGGAGVGKNITADNGAVRVNGTDGFLVTGTHSSGDAIDTEATGYGTRLFFNPRTSAFRAGYVNGAQWNHANIGNYSIALGNSPTASGNNSIALGYSSDATSINTTAIGYNVTASNQYASAFGTGTVASNIYAMAFGTSTTASGQRSTSFGYSTTASGTTSTAFGHQSNATGTYSTAFGYNSTTSGVGATSFGRNNTASGEYSTASGYNNTAPSAYETVIGLNSTNYTPTSAIGFSGTDRLFVIGNGTSSSSRSNALTIYKNGIVNINDAYNLPTADGTSNQILRTNGSGTTGWVNANTVFNDTDNQQIDVFNLSGTTLQLSLQDDGVATQTVDLSSLASGNTLDEAYDQGGAGVGKNITADNGAVRINGTDGFLVTGTWASGDTIDNEITGAGTRMFFNPRTSAFRAGYVNGTQWNHANIGNHSVAFGFNTTASGFISTAFGNQSTASGLHSTAIGDSTTASGDSSIALGDMTTASGSNSIALGHNTTASGNLSNTFGSNTTASGYNSTAHGYVTTASGNYSTTFGYYNTAPSAFETVIGLNSTNYTPSSTSGFIGTDRLFVIGNGTSPSARSNALTIFKNGTVNINDAYNLPTADGTANQVLQTNGSGVTNWVSPSTFSDSDWFVESTTNTATSINDNIYTQGNVAIGLTSASTRLHVDGNTTPFRVDVSGTERLLLNDNTLELKNTNNSTYIGEQVALSATGSDNTGLGYMSLDNLTTGSYNVAIGTSALDNNSTGSGNTALGYNAASNSNTIGTTAIGYNSLSVGTGTGNVSIGYNSMANSTTANQNVSIGYNTMQNTTASQNTIIGYNAMSGSSNTGGRNTAIGVGVMSSNTTGRDNVAIGYFSLDNNTTGYDNTAVGGAALTDNTSGIGNVAIGEIALENNTTGDDNVAIGKLAGHLLTTADNNTFIGNYSGYNATGSNNVHIGYSSGYNNSGSNRLFIDNSTTASPLIFGNFSTNEIGINWNSGTALPNTLSVNGNASKTTSGSWLANSDKRLKKNIITIESNSALQKLLQLRGVTYEWNDSQTGLNRPEGLQYGFVAQELMEVFPEKVTKDNLGFYQTAYGDYDAVFVQAFKELNNKIETLENENKQLKKELEKLQNLEKRISALEASNNSSNKKNKTQ